MLWLNSRHLIVVHSQVHIVFNRVSRISAGDLATSNFKQINYLAKLLSDCASKVELESQKKVLSATQFDLEVLRNDFNKSLGVVDQLSNSQYSQSNRISALESSVAGKIDRSEVDHLQGLVAKVLLYDAFKTDTTESLQQLHAHRLSASNRLGEHDAHLEEVDEEVRRLHEAVALAATKRDTKALALELQAQQDSIRLCSSKDALNKVSLGLQGGAYNFAALQRGVHVSFSAGGVVVDADPEARRPHRHTDPLPRGAGGRDRGRAGDEGELGGAARVRDAPALRAGRGRAGRRAGAQECPDHGVRLAKRTTGSSARHRYSYLRQVTLRLTNFRPLPTQNLEKVVSSESERLAVAMRFVDWFTSRGENYEHNMKVIDKHLKGLLVSPGDGGAGGGQALGAAGASTGGPAGPLGGIGAVASTATSSSVHSYYIPGNRVAFQPNLDHAR